MQINKLLNDLKCRRDYYWNNFFMLRYSQDIPKHNHVYFSWLYLDKYKKEISYDFLERFLAYLFIRLL